MTAVALAIALGTLLIKLVVLAAVIALMETQMAKLRLFRVPELLSVSFVLGLLAVTSAFLLR
jgi:formate hydrogenlyase subunit 4